MAIGWAPAGEGWNPGLADAECFYAADPMGFVDRASPSLSISVVRYGEAFGFLGLYIPCGRTAWPGVRHRPLAGRHGSQVVSSASTVLVAQQANYARSASRCASQRAFWCAAQVDAPNRASCRSMPPSSAVLAYDRTSSPPRATFFCAAGLRTTRERGWPRTARRGVRCLFAPVGAASRSGRSSPRGEREADFRVSRRGRRNLWICPSRT